MAKKLIIAIIILVIIFVSIGVIGLSIVNNNGIPALNFCTNNVGVCPDNSTVSRNPELNCEFNPCLSTANGGSEILLDLFDST